MKQTLSFVFLILFFICALCFPGDTFYGASKGLVLWFQTVLPTLLPFMVLSNLLIATNGADLLAHFISPILKPVFRVSESGCYAVLIGFLCGYPMGAKVIADLIRTERISRREGAYLLSFCNNSSLMFLISYLVTQNLGNSALMAPTLAIMLLSPCIVGFFFRLYYGRENFSAITPVRENAFQENPSRETSFQFHFDMADECIMNSFETLTKVGGYIILFSILYAWGELLPIKIFLPLLEITNGIPFIANLNLPFHISYPFILGITSFGGLCAAFQTLSAIRGSGLKFFPYIAQKLVTASVTSLLALFYVVVIC